MMMWLPLLLQEVRKLELELRQRLKKRVTLELGSNAAVIIDEDVELTDELIERVKWGAFVNNGQVCISVQRVLYMKREWMTFYQSYGKRWKQLLLVIR